MLLRVEMNKHPSWKNMMNTCINSTTKGEMMNSHHMFLQVVLLTVSIDLAGK